MRPKKRAASGSLGRRSTITQPVSCTMSLLPATSSSTGGNSIDVRRGTKLGLMHNGGQDLPSMVQLNRIDSNFAGRTSEINSMTARDGEELMTAFEGSGL